MSTERTPSKSLKREFQADSLYGDIDVKIGLVKDLLTVTTSLPIATFGQSKEEVSSECSALKSIYLKAREYFPEDAQKYDALNDLHKQQEALEESGSFYDVTLKTRSLKKYQALDEKIKTLETNPGIIFLDSLTTGINHLCENRTQLRDVQKAKKSKLDKEGFVDNPGAYSIKNREPRFVQYRRFSIAYFFNWFDYDKVTGSQTSFGLHEQGIHSYVSIPYDGVDDLVGTILEKQVPKKHIPADRFVTAMHEEGHAFMEGFRNMYSLPTLGASDRLFLTEDIRSEIEVFRDRPEQEEANLKRRMKHAANLSSEELLAELFSEPRKSHIPTSTFRNIDKKTRNAIDGMFKSEDPKVRAIIENSHPTFNFAETKNRIKNLYTRVLEKCPQKTIDLNIVFSLYPVSKMYRIEAIVDRWIAQEAA